MGNFIFCSSNDDDATLPPSSSLVRTPSTLLAGCDSRDEHLACVERAISASTSRTGSDGLQAVGFEYRSAPCDRCSAAEASSVRSQDVKDASHARFSAGPSPSASRNPQDPDHTVHCPDCTTRMYHILSNTLITADNRTAYIADGPMFDAVAKLCQEAVQDEMQKRYGFEWITLPYDDDRDETSGQEAPIRVLVSNFEAGCDKRSCKIQRPTLVVCPGRGAARAGIFSRHHLMTSGVEPSTALPMVLEARKRGMNVVLLDPNARGKRFFNETFLESISGLVTAENATDVLESSVRTDAATVCICRSDPLFILAHSASGGMLVRSLLDGVPQRRLFPRIRSIAFTDSTHNIQWAKLRGGNESLSELLESSACLYIRSNNVRAADTDTEARNMWRKTCGAEVETDHWWRHRFGSIRTLWAGTPDHALMNHSARDIIWDHFDSCELHLSKAQYQ